LTNVINITQFYVTQVLSVKRIRPMDDKATSSVMAKEHEMTNTGYED